MSVKKRAKKVPRQQRARLEKARLILAEICACYSRGHFDGALRSVAEPDGAAFRERRARNRAVRTYRMATCLRLQSPALAKKLGVSQTTAWQLIRKGERIVRGQETRGPWFAGQKGWWDEESLILA